MPVLVPSGRGSPARLQINEAVQEEGCQGIGSILGLSAQKGESMKSLRRTFSADMSWRQWLSLNLPPSPENISSTAASSTASLYHENWPSSSSSGDEREGRSKKDLDQQPEFDLWASLLSEQTPRNDPPPYIHPSEIQSKFVMSQESLDMCTEWLGSETGSDGFQSTHYYTPYSSGAAEDEEEDGAAAVPGDQDAGAYKSKLRRVKYSCCRPFARKIPSSQSFPPLLSTLAQKDGSRLQMRRRRESGRLIVDAIVVAAPEVLHARRENGRLKVSLMNPSFRSETLEAEEAAAGTEEEEETGIVAVDGGRGMEANKVPWSDQEGEEDEEMVRVAAGHPIPVMDKIFTWHGRHLDNENPWGCRKFEAEDDERSTTAPPKMSDAASFNGYERPWRVGGTTFQAKPQASSVNPRPSPGTAKNQPEPDADEKALSSQRCNEERKHGVVRPPFIIATT